MLSKLPVPTRQLKIFTSTKEVPSNMVRLSEGRSKYWNKTNQAAMPTTVVSNSAVRMFYGPSTDYWEEPSDLDNMPWLPAESKEIKTPHGTYNLNDLAVFKLGRYKDQQIDLDNQSTFLPKLDALPVCFLGWTEVSYYQKSQIRPHSAGFLKSDCIPVDQATKSTLEHGKIMLSTEQEVPELGDPRFVLVAARNSNLSFVVKGALYPKEWKKYDIYPVPGAPEPCTIEHTVPARNHYGVPIPKKLHEKIQPEWFHEGMFYVCYETALKHLPAFGQELDTPARWVSNIKLPSNNYSRSRQSPTPTSVSMEMSSLRSSDIHISEATWQSDNIGFEISQINAWPSNPTACRIGGVLGFLCREEPDPKKWKIVRKDSHPNDRAYVYPHPGSRGFRKIHVVDMQQEQAKQAQLTAVEQKLGKNFEAQLRQYLGSFKPENAEQYIKAAEYLKSHEVVQIPPYLGEAKRVFPDYHFSTLEEGQRALKAVRADFNMHGTEKTLVYLWFKTNLETQKEIETLLKLSEQSVAEALERMRSKKAPKTV